jgi:hypothetical protein
MQFETLIAALTLLDSALAAPAVAKAETVGNTDAGKGLLTTPSSCY